jgi:hypothetical protein
MNQREAKRIVCAHAVELLEQSFSDGTIVACANDADDAARISAAYGELLGELSRRCVKLVRKGNDDDSNRRNNKSIE